MLKTVTELDKKGGVKAKVLAGNGQQLAKASRSHENVESLNEEFAAVRSGEASPDVYKDKKGEFRFRFKLGRTIVLSASEGYKRKRDAQHASDRIAAELPDAQAPTAEPTAEPAVPKGRKQVLMGSRMITVDE